MVDRATPTKFAASLDIRHIGAIGGCYTLTEADQPIVYACRTTSASPSMLVVQAPVRGRVGERVAMRFDQLGILNGSISRVSRDGFHVSVIADEAERQRLAAKINWIKKRSVRQADDKRSGARFRPRHPRGVLVIGEHAHECFIIDLSSTGAALSSSAQPPIGTAVHVGRVTGKIVRYFEGGFGVRFDEARRPEDVEAELTQGA